MERILAGLAHAIEDWHRCGTSSIGVTFIRGFKPTIRYYHLMGRITALSRPMERVDVESRWSTLSAAITDPERLAAVRATDLPDSAPDENCERLTRLASRNLRTPVSVLSMADGRRQFFTSTRGPTELPASFQGMPRSLCELVVSTSTPIAIGDAKQHPLMPASRVLLDLHLVAYLGVPLIRPDGRSLGALCVADFATREWSEDDIETLSDLAALAVRDIALRRSSTKLDRHASDRRRRATTIRLTDERLRLLLGAARAGLWELDLVSGRQIWSPEIFALLGCDSAAEPFCPAEFVARFVHPDDRGLVESTLEKIISGREIGRRLDIEYRIIRPNGAMLWVNATGHIEQDEFGQPVRVIGICRDVSARKFAEQAQRESAQFIKDITVVTPDYLYVLDLDEHRCIYKNRPLTEVFGYDSSDEDEASLIRRLMHPEDHERTMAYRQSLYHLEDHAVAPCECRFRRADGTWGWFLMRHAALSRSCDGSVRQVVGTLTEITALKHAEHELRTVNMELEQRVAARTAELSSANRELESFAYSVSHDLRAPLRAINSFNDLLIEHCGNQLDATSKHYLKRVQGAARRMGEFIDALLTLSRTTHGQFAQQRVNISELARSITSDLARSEPDRGVTFLIADDVMTIADPVLLRIALENLLGNAWKFTTGKQRACIEFGARCTEHGQTFFVRDDGAGFDMEHAPRLFAPFQRLHTAAEFPGSGIGLATVQRIVERHGGHIWAEGTLGTGATFYFTLAGAVPAHVGAHP